MKNNKATLLVTEIVGIIILIITFVLQVVLKTDFRIGSFLTIGYIALVLVVFGIYKAPNMTEMIYKNKMILMYTEVSSIVILLGVRAECYFGKCTVLSYVLIMSSVIAFLIVNIRTFIKDPKKDNYINLVLGTYIFLYLQLF